jgi:cytochrome c oxidase subunit 2
VRIASVLLAAAAAAAGQGQRGEPLPVGADGSERVISVSARRFTYTPNVIEVELGVPVIIELTSLDRAHGFSVPELGLRADVEPGKTARVRIVPDKLGTFDFHCDIFCGSGHEEMAGRIVVVSPRQTRR